MLAQFVFLFFAHDFPRNFSLGAKRAERRTGEGETTISPPQTTARFASLADIYTVFFFFAFFRRRHQTQVRETSTETGRENCQCYCKKQIDNNFPWSMTLSTMDFAGKPKRFLNILTSFLWSIRIQTMQNCCLFVKS